jgi:hypothetical protein
MDGTQFDILARRLAGATSRRTLIAGFAAAVLGGHFTRAEVAAQGDCESDDDCGNCEYCLNPGASGTCEFVPSSQDPKNDCPDQNHCDGNGGCSCAGPFSPCTVNESCCGGGDCVNRQCFIRNGFGCLESNWCVSGFCVNQVCCDSACEGECNDCGVIGGSGICTDVDANCSDGNNCTVDICTAGSCSSSPIDCSDLDELCRSGVCDAQTGACVAVNNDDDFVCGTNAACSGGECLCMSGHILCDNTCVAGNCCDASDCDMQGEVDESVCAAMICENHTCQLATGDVACGPCQECDLESLNCVDRCSGDECCCEDNESCSTDCCPDEQCKRDKDCPKGHCCCHDGSCDAKCCGGDQKTPPPPSTKSPALMVPAATSVSTVSTLPGTGAGSAVDGRGAIAGLAVASGMAAWIASKLRSGQPSEHSE